MKSVLLLGAGFSRNWGGWLAPEAFEYLLGCPQVDASLKDLLWTHQRSGGFEAALAELQDEHFRRGGAPEQRLADLMSAIVQMFSDMNMAFEDVPFEFQNEIQFRVSSFLVQFDAIFTLNLDLLLERHYFNENVGLSKKWDGWQIPGMKFAEPPTSGLANRALGKWEPDTSLNVGARLQPFFKLHGSTNWVGSESEDILVLGGNKTSIIEHYPVIKLSHERFKKCLSQSETRLMVIGYSFGDDHINKAIREAAVDGGLNIFIIDPLGVDVVDKNRNAQIYAPGELAKDLRQNLIGSSRRSLREIFGDDRVEHGKVMRFFS